eukprot:gene4335-6137_t
MSTVSSLTDELIVLILSYLRAIDLTNISLVNKTLFTNIRISQSIKLLISNVYIPFLNSPCLTISPIKRNLISNYLEYYSDSNNSDSIAFVNNENNVRSVVSKNTVPLKPDLLYFYEINSIILALNCGSNSNSSGYWISTSWIANAKKYFDALALPDINYYKTYNTNISSKKSKPKITKQSKIRQRRGSDCLPPWPRINDDIVCIHGNMSSNKGKACPKRKVIHFHAWLFLRRFYPFGPQFKYNNNLQQKTATGTNNNEECIECYISNEDNKAIIDKKKETDLMNRRLELLSPFLTSLFNRKNGIPSSPTHNTTNKDDHYESITKNYTENYSFGNGNNNKTSILFDINDYDLSTLDSSLLDLSFNSSISIPSNLQVLLIPSGLYNLIPRDWLKLWRKYLKDTSVSTLPPLDCTRLLCHAHGLLVVPPHVEEYLLGLRKSLLGGLGTYPGQIVEIISAEEWDELSNKLKYFDVNIRFSFENGYSNHNTTSNPYNNHERVSWSMGICRVCDPFNYNPLLIMNNKKKSNSSSSLSALTALRSDNLLMEHFHEYSHNNNSENNHNIH